MYDYLKEVNAFLRKNGRKLVDWNCIDTARYKNGKKVNGMANAVTPEGENFDLIIGTYMKGDNQCLVIANASYNKTAKFSLLQDKKFKEVKVIDTIDAKFDDKKEGWKLSPGGCAVIFLTQISQISTN